MNKLNFGTVPKYLIVYSFFAILTPLWAQDNVWKETDLPDAISSAWFLNPTHWTTGTKTDGGYYLANDQAVTVSENLTIDAPLYIGYDSSDTKQQLNTLPGTGSLTVQGDLTTKKLLIGNHWGSVQDSGNGTVQVAGSLTVTGDLSVGRNGFGALSVGTSASGESVQIGSAAAPVTVRFSSQNNSSVTILDAPLTRIDFSQAENVTIYANTFQIAAIPTGFTDNFKPDTSKQKFMHGANVTLGTNNTISTNSLIFASSYGLASTTNSTLEFGEGTNDVSIGSEMVIGGLKADKLPEVAADAVNVVSIREGGSFSLHGIDGRNSKTNLSIAENTCGTTNISYGTLDLRKASSVQMTLGTLKIGYKSEDDTSPLTRYGGAAGFLYLGDAAVVTADLIQMAFKSDKLIDTVKHTSGTLDFGGQTSVTANSLRLGNDTHAYCISSSTINMNGGSFLVTNGAEFFDDVNLNISSSQNPDATLQNNGIFRIYSPQYWSKIQNSSETIDPSLSNIALRAASNADIKISGNGQQLIYGDVVCVQDANAESSPDGSLILTLSDNGKYYVYGDFAAGNGSVMTLSGNSEFFVEGISRFEGRSISILDENGTLQKGPTHGVVQKNISGNAIYRVDGGIELKGNSIFSVSDSGKVLLSGDLNLNSSHEVVVYQYDPQSQGFKTVEETITQNGKGQFFVSGGVVDLNTLRLSGTWEHMMTSGNVYANSIVTVFNNENDTHDFTLAGGNVFAKTIAQEPLAFKSTKPPRSEIQFTGGELSVLQIGTPDCPFDLEQSQSGSEPSILNVGDSVTVKSGNVISNSRFGTTKIYGNYALKDGTIAMEMNGSKRDHLQIFGTFSSNNGTMNFDIGTEGIDFDGNFTENGTDYSYVTLLAAETFSDLLSEELPEVGERVVSTLDLNYIWPKSLEEGWSYFIFANGNQYELQGAKALLLPEPSTLALLLFGVIGLSWTIHQKRTQKESRTAQ